MLKFQTNSAKQTISFAKSIAKNFKGSDVVILEGDLGAGKTTFIKGILEGLGYRKRVLSPTFTLLRQYKLKTICVYHLDFYRLKHNDIFSLGIDDFLYSKAALTFIEWGDKLKDDLDKYIVISFSFLAEDKREISFSFKGYDNKRFKLLKKVKGS
tara:strand:- start:1784 stop:2248 length:465 start_codon:yes stop_codon:yes gene_type:complete